ncbi:MAG: HEAT repeat domain-containing protein [Planctomycetes bacterium]|nr:HEAT repeat domain-containing protein [Planctomycetota bacterium]
MKWFLSAFLGAAFVSAATVTVPPHGNVPVPPVAPADPGPVGPNVPPPSSNPPPGPRSPNPAPPAQPTGAGSPSVGAPKAPGTGGAGGSGGAGTATPQPSSQDIADWRVWWTFHRDEFLDLKDALDRGNALTTGEDELLGGTSAGGAQRPDPRKLHDVVVPALLAALRGERNPDVLTSCMMALAKLGRGPCPADAAAIETALRPFLADPVQEVAETAALALGLNAAPSSAMLLVGLAGDDERGRALVQQTEVPTRTRAFACYGLGLLGARANADVRRFVVHHLVQTFEKDKAATRDVRTAVLVAMSQLEIAPSARGDATYAPSSSLESDLAWLLGIWRDPQQSELVRVHAATTAARLAPGAPAAAALPWKGALCDALEPTATVPGILRQGAALALGACCDNDDDEADARARALLQRAVRDGDGLTRRFAAISLARVGARDGKGAHTSENLRATRTFLLGEFEGASSTLRPWLALALGTCEALRLRSGADASTEVQAALVKALAQRKSPGDAGALCLAAALTRAPEARDSIVEWTVGNQESEARPYAALALGLLGWDGGVLPLRKAVLDAKNRPLLLREASIALGLLGSNEVVPTLVRSLAESESLPWQSAIAGALSYVGDARAIDPLLALLEKGKRPDRMRSFAAAALGGVCDRERIPWNAPIGFTVHYAVPPATLYEPSSGTGILDLF